MQKKRIISVINSIHNLPYGSVIVDNNKIKIDILWKNESVAYHFANSLKPSICRNIKINHYLWIRYLTSSHQEMEDRICIFPPHRAAEENVIGNSIKSK